MYHELVNQFNSLLTDNKNNKKTLIAIMLGRIIHVNLLSEISFEQISKISNINSINVVIPHKSLYHAVFIYSKKPLLTTSNLRTYRLIFLIKHHPNKNH